MSQLTLCARLKMCTHTMPKVGYFLNYVLLVYHFRADACTLLSAKAKPYRLISK